MKKLIVLASLSFAIVGALASSHCGGSAPSAAGPASSAQSPAGQCLAVAGAKRQKTPNEPAKVSVRHVLVKYSGAKNAAATITRSRDEACLRALAARVGVGNGSS